MRLIVITLAFALSSVLVHASEKEGYYYPPVNSQEVFNRNLTDEPPTTNRAIRIAFITEITKAQMEAPETPRFSIFAKGLDAEHMIIVALDDQVFRTLYRARAVLAQLTSNARGTEFFIKSGIADKATWFDLAKLLGFEDIVITDGDLWSHRIELE